MNVFNIINIENQLLINIYLTYLKNYNIGGYINWNNKSRLLRYTIEFNKHGKLFRKKSLKRDERKNKPSSPNTYPYDHPRAAKTGKKSRK